MFYRRWRASMVDAITKLARRIDRMSQALDDLVAQEGKNTDVIETAVTVIGGFQTTLRDMQAKLDAAIASAGDPAVLANLKQHMADEDAKLSAALDALKAPAADTSGNTATDTPQGGGVTA